MGESAFEDAFFTSPVMVIVVPGHEHWITPNEVDDKVTSLRIKWESETAIWTREGLSRSRFSIFIYFEFWKINKMKSFMVFIRVMQIKC